MRTSSVPQPEEPPQPREQPWWNPGIWLGFTFLAWARLQIRHRFDVAPSRLYAAVVSTVASLFNSALGALQELEYGRQIARIEIRDPPIFIIGHWRTGTTLLHELLSLDPRHTAPKTYYCLAPSHFLLTERSASRRLKFLFPPRRAMDDMPWGWDRPQEDEFALCSLGIPSPYLTIAFPNHPPQYPEYVDLEEISPDALEQWKRAFMRFLKQLTVREPKRIILKSPLHTCRIKVLLQLFPDARFVHLVRDPIAIFSSTRHMWKSIYLALALQVPTYEGLDEYVFEVFERMHKRLEETRHLVDPARFHELRYEDLVADPIGQMRLLYDRLELGAFDRAQPALAEYVASVRNYKANHYPPDPELSAEITRRWGPYMRKYGYGAGLEM